MSVKYSFLHIKGELLAGIWIQPQLTTQMTFWKKIKSIFQSAEQSSKTVPVEHKLIERSEQELLAYERWKASVTSRRLLNWLNEQYVQYLVNPDHTDETIDFLNTPSSKGFVIHFKQTQYPKSEITHLFDLLKEKVLELNYRTYVSDSRTYSKNTWVENLQRHYLKPPSNLRNNPSTKEKFNQRFGNITIELLTRDDQIFHLKFSATGYHDHLFSEIEDFKGLMQGILS